MQNYNFHEKLSHGWQWPTSKCDTQGTTSNDAHTTVIIDKYQSHSNNKLSVWHRNAVLSPTFISEAEGILTRDISNIEVEKINHKRATKDVTDFLNGGHKWASVKCSCV